MSSSPSSTAGTTSSPPRHPLAPPPPLPDSLIIAHTPSSSPHRRHHPHHPYRHGHHRIPHHHAHAHVHGHGFARTRSHSSNDGTRIPQSSCRPRHRNCPPRTLSSTSVASSPFSGNPIEAVMPAWPPGAAPGAPAAPTAAPSLRWASAAPTQTRARKSRSFLLAVALTSAALAAATLSDAGKLQAGNAEGPTLKGSNKSLQGSCYCGSIKFAVSGNPEANIYCHCKDCRKAHSAPMYQASYFQPSNFKLVEGGNLLRTFRKGNADVERAFCTRCGSRIFTKVFRSDHGVEGAIGIFPSLVDEGPPLPKNLSPHIHLHAHHATLDLSQLFDDLPRYMAGGEEQPPPSID